MSVEARSQVLTPFIVRGEQVVADFDAPEGVSYTLTGSTFRFAIGKTAESPTVTVNSAGDASGQVTNPTGTTVRVTIETAGTRTLVAGRNKWTLYETISSKEKVIGMGVVEVVAGEGTLAS